MLSSAMAVLGGPPVVLCGVKRKLQGGGTLLLRASTTATPHG